MSQSRMMPQDETPLVLARPIALKVVRPIPKQATEEFYRVAHELALEGVHEAVMESHEWHRKWTQQEETGHGYHHSSANQRGKVPSHYAYDRCAGAKNPSPEDKDSAQDPRKRRASRVTRSRASPNQRTVKRSATNLVRPIALRVARPTITTTTTRIDSRFNEPASLPKDIFERSDSMSPLTVASSVDNTTPYTKERLSVHVIEDYEINTAPITTTNVSELPRHSADILSARDALFEALAIAGGDVQSTQFKNSLDTLSAQFSALQVDHPYERSQGIWLTLTKPTFFGNLGENDNGDPMYTLGRMSFDMFSPTNLICSLQGNFNSVEQVSRENVPAALREVANADQQLFYSYNIISAFTIEPHMASYGDAPNKDVRRPIKGLMTTYGYTLPDPDVPNRHSLWITGGRIAPNNDPKDEEDWHNQFSRHPPKHDFREQAKLLAFKLLMGATVATELAADGSLSYTFVRPLGGHKVAYLDTLYVDDSLRIVRGHRGTVFVFSRMRDIEED